jgi:hypothetical protein
MKSLERVLRCDCGFEARAEHEDELVAEVQRHAWEAHAMALAPDEARSLAQANRKLESAAEAADTVLAPARNRGLAPQTQTGSDAKLVAQRHGEGELHGRFDHDPTSDQGRKL